jgi:hypothetical protein
MNGVITDILTAITMAAKSSKKNTKGMSQYFRD